MTVIKKYFRGTSAKIQLRKSYLNACSSMWCNLLATKTKVCNRKPSNALSGNTSRLDILMSKCCNSIRGHSEKEIFNQ